MSPDPERQQMIQELKETGERLGKKSVSRSEFLRETGRCVSTSTVGMILSELLISSRSTMVAQELGYVVESITPGFPDCEAKRRVRKACDTWERVRIEFEFESRNFLTHGHNIAKCDVIVCWEHNWQTCPIEVLELKSSIQSLDA